MDNYTDIEKTVAATLAAGLLAGMPSQGVVSDSLSRNPHAAVSLYRECLKALRSEPEPTE